MQLEKDGQSNLPKEVVLGAEQQADTAEHDERSVRNCVWLSMTVAATPSIHHLGSLRPALMGILPQLVTLAGQHV